MKIRILKTRRRIIFSPFVINLTDEARKWREITAKLHKRIGTKDKGGGDRG